MWSHTASILTLIANVNRGKNQRAFKPSDFDPHAQSQKEDAIEVANMGELRAAFEKMR